jgi:hypothetical protein
VKPASQSNSISDHIGASKHSINLDRLISLETAKLKKPISSGLRNIQTFKSKPKTKSK